MTLTVVRRRCRGVSLVASLLLADIGAAPRLAAAAQREDAPARQAQDRFAKGIRYLGGPGLPEPKSIGDTWDHSLSVSREEIVFGFAGDKRPPVRIQPESARFLLVYGQASQPHVKSMIGAALLVGPLALVGFAKKSRKHHLLVNWGESREERSLYLQLHKDAYKQILSSLTLHTGKPLFANANDQKWLAEHGVKAQLDQSVP